MTKAFILTLIGIIIFPICYLLVHRIGAQFIKIAPATESAINVGVLIISFLMTLVALRQIYGLFQSKRKNW